MGQRLKGLGIRDGLRPHVLTMLETAFASTRVKPTSTVVIFTSERSHKGGVNGGRRDCDGGPGGSAPGHRGAVSPSIAFD
jgi:hypothetical protein